MVITKREPATDRQQQQVEQPVKYEKSKLPPPPAKKIQHTHAEQFFEYLKSLGETDWSHCTIYLYRLWPIMKAEGAHNIDKFLEMVTSEAILQRHGAGRYKLILTDQDLKKYGQVCEARVHLDDSWEKYPPVLANWNELDLDHKDNQAFIAWARAKGFLPMLNTTPAAAGGNDSALIGLVTKLIGELQTRRPQNDAEASAISKITDMFGKAHDKSLDMAMKQQDPQQLLNMFQMLEKLLTRDNSSDKLLDFVLKTQGGSGSSDTMLKFLFDSQVKQMELFTKVLEAKTSAADPLEQFTKMLGAFSQLKETFGGGAEAAGSNAPWYAQLGVYALDKIPEVLRQGTDLFRAMNARPAGAPAAAAVRTPAELPPAAGAPQATAGEAPGGDSQMIQQMLNQMGGMLLSALSRGLSGDRFAESIDDLYGYKVYSMIVNVGKDRIMAELQANPALWPQLAPIQPQLEQFIDDFLAYNEEDPPEDPGDPAAKADGPHRVK